jgi:hypothetical protein
LAPSPQLFAAADGPRLIHRNPAAALRHVNGWRGTASRLARMELLWLIGRWLLAGAVTLATLAGLVIAVLS